MLSEVRFYTGFPDAQDDAMWNRFWSRKLLAIKRQGVNVYSRPLRYAPQAPNIRGINSTDWVRIERDAYDGCVDAYDYRS